MSSSLIVSADDTSLSCRADASEFICSIDTRATILARQRLAHSSLSDKTRAGGKRKTHIGPTLFYWHHKQVGYFSRLRNVSVNKDSLPTSQLGAMLPWLIATEVVGVYLVVIHASVLAGIRITQVHPCRALGRNTIQFTALNDYWQHSKTNLNGLLLKPADLVKRA